jgi:hypothetical protein
MKMKIGMMSAWNTDSGVAVHAEPVGKAWRKMGHELTVFNFIKDDYHGEGFTGNNEKYVIECFGTRQKTGFFDPRPILTRPFDIFVVQDLNMLPIEGLSNIFSLIKRKAKTVHIVHENVLPKEAWFYKLDWDGVIYFCKRQKFLNEVYPNAQLIHFPCFALRKKDKIEARERLGLPLDKKIIYEFCQRGYKPFLREPPEKLKDKAVLLVVIPPKYEFLEEGNPPPWMIVRREETLSHDRFDDYLFASDAVILHKFSSRYHAVVSSTAFQTLGTGCPILVPGESDFFFTFKDEVVRYEGVEGLKKILLDLMANKDKRKDLKKKTEKFVKENSPQKIAEQHIKLFSSLLKKGR